MQVLPSSFIWLESVFFAIMYSSKLSSVRTLVVIAGYVSYFWLFHSIRLSLVVMLPLNEHPLMEEPVNPFTGNPIDDTAKKEGKLYITTAENYDQNPGNTIDMTGGVWYTLTGEDIFDKNNWKKVEEPVVE